jgi:hypothetical protein
MTYFFFYGSGKRTPLRTATVWTVAGVLLVSPEATFDSGMVRASRSLVGAGSPRPLFRATKRRPYNGWNGEGKIGVIQDLRDGMDRGESVVR